MLIDLTGQTFGRWTVLRRDGSTNRGSACWLCRCSCGVERVVPASNLRRGMSKGCKACSVAATLEAASLAGQRFRRWLVLRKAPNRPDGKRQWLCRCDCGAEALVSAENLRRGKSKGCVVCGRARRPGMGKPPRAAQSERVTTMTPRDFCCWLNGFFEVHGASGGKLIIRPEQAELIRRRLALVFAPESAPPAGDAPPAADQPASA